MYIRKDGYYRLAKRQGYRSRAAFKLIQLNDSYAIIHAHDNVLDIGAAPGGWMQVITDIIGEGGTVVGIDPLDIPPIPGPVHAAAAATLKGDINDPGVRQRACGIIKARFDAVVSDVSVNISGNAPSDIYRNMEMARSIVGYLPGLLRRGGNFLMKLFYSNELKPFLAVAEKCFDRTYATKPKASRSSSSELYLIGKGFCALTQECPGTGDKEGAPVVR
ncbi:MAG: RlmE family RNA methyltransferase [Deltaproteobacteria bacterium]|nr:RlmE family RNA methyltransferase [Deltaproteobacteria bacterium]